ncbi:MAG: S8 family serine peptidase [Gammaproteobacteria bacterium]|nr:S8 family serine peptidase [Gammaproteobacteria bacterium]
MVARMGLRRLLAVLLGGIVLATFCAASVAAGTPAGQYAPGQVLVKFKPSLTSQQRAAMVSAMGSAAHTNYQSQWVRVTLGPGQSVRQAVSEYQGDPNIEYAQPNYIYHATALPDDPEFGQLWAFQNTGQAVSFAPVQGEGRIDPTDNPGTPGDDMDIVPAWNHITDCSSVIVAVVDSGVNYNQEDLAANMWNGSGVTYNGFPLVNHGYNFVDNNNDPMDYLGHGTHVAGIIGAVGNNGIGTTGVCWKANIMAVRVLDASGSGTTSNVVQGIDFAVANGAKVINLSLGGEGPFDQAFSDAITNAENHDVVVVVAAGNNGTDNDAAGNSFYPCDFTQPNLICVAALDQKFALASFSDWGPTSVDVGAPGTNIVSTYAGNNGEVTVPFASGWTETKTSASSNGWTAANTGLSGSTPVPMLVDPSGWPTGLYAPNTDDRAYATFNLSGVNAAVVNANLYANVTSDGSISLAYSPSGGDPFAPTSPYYLWGPYYTDTSPTQPSASSLFSISADISACATATCTIGVELSTGTTADYGAALYGLSVNTLTLTTNAYNILNGTSMATPEVTGLAAMLRAYNPQDNYSDVVNAIELGGRPVASLAGMTTSGNAIDVMKSLAYLSPPTGLQATIK